MSKIYSPRIVQDSLVMCLDPSQNKSYPTTDLPVKDGLLLWLDASDDSSFSYSSGTEVSQWRDKSGNNFHANQATVANQPSRNSIINSRKGVNFTSVNGDFMRVSSGIVTPNYITLFAAIKPATQDNSYAIIMEQDHGNGYNGWVIQRNGATSYWLSWVAGNAVTWLNPNQIAYTDNTSQIVTLRKNTSTINLYSNGTSSGAVSISDSTITQSGYGLNLGYWQYGGGRYYNGTICEILVFNRGLSDTELKQVNTYLGQKWSISNTDRSIIDLSGFDDSGLLGNGTTTNIPAFDYYNKGAFKFYASNKYIKLGNNTNINQFTGDFTISLWAMANAENSNYGNLIGDYYTAGVATTNEWQIMMNNSSTALNVYRHGTGYVVNNTASGFSANTWINVVLTRIGSAVSLYANNTVIATATNSSVFGSATGSVNIGIDGNNSAEPFSGLISNVLIYKKGLSAAEVLQNYQAQKSKFDNTIVQQGLVLNLDAANPYSYAGAGTTWYDVSGAVNDFTAVNSPTYSAGEFILNGSTQYFSISTGSGFFISSTNNFYADVGYAWSISIWFKFPVSPTTVRNSTINGGNCSYSMIGNAGGIGGAETLSLFVSGGDSSTSAGGLAPYYCVVGVRGSKTQLSAGSVNTNTWNHVVVTWNGSAGRGYFNGVDKGALNIGANAMQVSGYTVGATAGGASSHVFEGSLSQVFVYNRALSAAEVLQNYNATKGRFGL